MPSSPYATSTPAFLSTLLSLMVFAFTINVGEVCSAQVVSNLTRVATAPTNSTFGGMGLTADGSIAYLIGYLEDAEESSVLWSLALTGSSTETLMTVATPPTHDSFGEGGIAITADGSTAYLFGVTYNATVPEATLFSVALPSTGTPTTVLTTSGLLGGLAVTADGSTAYLTGFTYDATTDTNSGWLVSMVLPGTSIKTVASGPFLGPVAMTADGTTAYLTGLTYNVTLGSWTYLLLSVVLVGASTGTVTTVVAVPTVDCLESGVAVTADGSTAYLFYFPYCYAFPPSYTLWSVALTGSSIGTLTTVVTAPSPGFVYNPMTVTADGSTVYLLGYYALWSVALGCPTFTLPMTLDVTGAVFIQYFEGFAPFFYFDSTNHPTIGYGHNCAARSQPCTGPMYSKGYLTAYQSETLFQQDVTAAIASVLSLLGPANVPGLVLTQNQFNVIVDIMFNYGAPYYVNGVRHGFPLSMITFLTSQAASHPGTLIPLEDFADALDDMSTASTAPNRNMAEQQLALLCDTPNPDTLVFTGTGVDKTTGNSYSYSYSIQNAPQTDGEFCGDENKGVSGICLDPQLYPCGFPSAYYGGLCPFTAVCCAATPSGGSIQITLKLNLPFKNNIPQHPRDRGVTSNWTAQAFFDQMQADLESIANNLASTFPSSGGRRLLQNNNGSFVIILLDIVPNPVDFNQTGFVSLNITTSNPLDVISFQEAVVNSSTSILSQYNTTQFFDPGYFLAIPYGPNGTSMDYSSNYSSYLTSDVTATGSSGSSSPSAPMSSSLSWLASSPLSPSTAQQSSQSSSAWTSSLFSTSTTTLSGSSPIPSSSTPLTYSGTTSSSAASSVSLSSTALPSLLVLSSSLSSVSPSSQVSCSTYTSSSTSSVRLTYSESASETSTSSASFISGSSSIGVTAPDIVCGTVVLTVLNVISFLLA